MTKEQEQKIASVVDSLANDPDIQSLVKSIEARPATTQDHYGDYGAAISSLAGGSKTTAFVIAQAFKKAGANQQGVDWALRLFV